MKDDIKVTIKDLSKDNVYGWAYLTKNKIELDKKLKGYRFLLYLIHEILHIRNPEWSETKIRKEASVLAKNIWKQRS